MTANIPSSPQSSSSLLPAFLPKHPDAAFAYEDEGGYGTPPCSSPPPISHAVTPFNDRKRLAAASMAAANVGGHYLTPAPSSSLGIEPSSPVSHPVGEEAISYPSSPTAKKFASISEQSRSFTVRSPLSTVVLIRVGRDGEKVLVGRSSKKCHVALPSKSRAISRHHATVWYDAKENEVLIDCEGWNGLTVVVPRYKRDELDSWCANRTYPAAVGEKEYEVNRDQTIQVKHVPGITITIGEERALVEVVDATMDDETEDECVEPHAAAAHQIAEIVPEPIVSQSPADDEDQSIDNNVKTPEKTMTHDQSQHHVTVPTPQIENMNRVFSSPMGMSESDEDKENVQPEDDNLEDDQFYDAPAMGVDLDDIEEEEEEEAAPSQFFRASAEEPTFRRAASEEPSPSSKREFRRAASEEPSPSGRLVLPHEQIKVTSLQSKLERSNVLKEKTNINAKSKRQLDDEEEEESKPRKKRSKSQEPEEHQQLDDEDLQNIKNVVANHLAFSRVYQSPISVIQKSNNLLSSLPKAQLRGILQTIGCVGIIQREGKDAAGKPLEEEYFYEVANDTDEHRVAMVGQIKGGGMRSCRKTHKQYFWKRPALR